MSVVVSFAPGPEGEAALAEASRQAQEVGRPLVVVCTVPTDEARAQARHMTASLAGAHVVEVHEGEDAVERILDEVEKVEPALLVIGLRRRTPVGKLVLGSSAQRLLLDASCPVLAVKP